MKKRHKSRGFTLTETLIIIAIVGIIAVIAAPSFGGLLDSMRLNQTITEIRVSLSNAQRQAIRNHDVCDVGITINHSQTQTTEATSPAEMYVDCLTSKDQTFSKKIQVASNIVPFGSVIAQSEVSNDYEFGDDEKDSKKADKNAAWCEKHKTHNHKNWDKKCSQSEPEQGNPIVFSEASFGQNGIANFDIFSNNTSAPDPTGKIVIYTQGKEAGVKKCIALSQRIGLTRIGNYNGNLDPSSITDDGVCTSLKWNKQ